MIFKIENDSQNLLEQCNELLIEVNNNYNFQMNRKKTLLLCIDKISNAIDNLVDVNYADLLFIMIDKIKIEFEKVNYNIEKYQSLNDILAKLKNIIVQGIDNDSAISPIVDSFNEYYKTFQKTVNDNNNEIENFIQNYINGCNLIVANSKSVVTNNQVPSNNTEIAKTSNSSDNINTTNAFGNNIVDTYNETDPEKEKKIISDNNILLISEKQKKVFLPYKKRDLEMILKSTRKKYVDLEDLINKKYIVPLSRFKSPIIARFKEAFHLMREKENSSFSEALDLAIELSFYRSLNPAVILACKNLDELDYYLDCLDNEQLDKFTDFKIQYDINPVVKS